ncbi:MAG: hypothetical protein ACQEW5_28145 [Bacillota bacterium]
MKNFNRIFMVFLSLVLFTAIVSIHSNVQAITADGIDAAKAAEEITGTEELVKADDDDGSINNEINTIKLPDQFLNEIVVSSDPNNEPDIKIGIPNEMELGNPVVTKDGSYQYNGEENVDLVIQPTEGGVRSIVSINNENAPKKYDFKLDLPEGHKLVFSSDYYGEELAMEDDIEEVFVVDENNIIQSIFGEAWAKDANGNDVPTHYEIIDNSLIQVVEFNKNTAFPVLADPDWVAIGACAAALTWFVGSNLFMAAKIIKVKKYINALGGFKETAKLITGATTWEEKLRVGGSALKSLAAEITGVAGLYACNKFIKR